MWKCLTFRSYLYRHLFWADELFQSCLIYIRGLYEDAINISGYNKHVNNPSAVCLVKVGGVIFYKLMLTSRNLVE